MPTPKEHKTAQAQILASVEAIGWTIASREEAERRRGFDPAMIHAQHDGNRSLFFDELLDTKVQDFNLPNLEQINFR